MNRRLLTNETGHSVLLGVLAVVVVCAVVFAGWRIYKNDQNALQPSTAVTTNNTFGTSSSGQTSSKAATEPLPAGTANSSLQSDLSNINVSLLQQTSDQNSASAAINDSQSEISVPTN